jgi:chemotaxis protein methyltransferase CheR
MDEREAFEKLKDAIYRERGLDVSQYKENYLKRRLAVRMRALQLINYESYLNWLNTYNGEYNTLLDKLTINVTQFFRDPEVFVEFEKNILPDILSRAGGRLKVWSAGCSTGEEPFSIAIAIEEAAEKMGIQGPEYEISATDIDDAALFKAYEGAFEGRTLDNVAEPRKRKYFSFDGKNYIITDKIKKKVKFLKANLMDPFRRNFFDVIFCRNVIIYFSKELQRKVLQYFYDGLREEGVFFMGKTETMLRDLRDKFRCINIKERIFEKTNTGGAEGTKE